MIRSIFLSHEQLQPYHTFKLCLYLGMLIASSIAWLFLFFHSSIWPTHQKISLHTATHSNKFFIPYSSLPLSRNSYSLPLLSFLSPPPRNGTTYAGGGGEATLDGRDGDGSAGWPRVEAEAVQLDGHRPCRREAERSDADARRLREAASDHRGRRQPSRMWPGTEATSTAGAWGETEGRGERDVSGPQLTNRCGLSNLACYWACLASRKAWPVSWRVCWRVIFYVSFNLVRRVIWSLC